MARLRCECRHRIWSELWWKNSGEVLLFFDDVAASESYGERVSVCPGCGRRLGGRVLELERAEHRNEDGL